MSDSEELPQELLSVVMTCEGCYLKVYLCPAGIPTIGYGHTGKDVFLGMSPITKERATELLKQDLTAFWNGTGTLSPILLGYALKHSAVTSFAFNCGLSAYKASTFRRYVQNGHWEEAARELQKWIRGGGRVLPGLVKRRALEAHLLLQ